MNQNSSDASTDVRQGELLNKEVAQPNIIDSLSHNSSYKPFCKIDKTIRIAVSGDVLITELEKKIIDTPSFQRLRGIKQLATVNYVYPTAIHTRFDHSLGTLKMAVKMLDCIEKNTHSDFDERNITPEQYILTRLYALLHDVTHIPYGHTLEDELGLLTRHDENPARLLKFLGKDSEIGQLLIKEHGEPFLKKFIKIYIWEENEEHFKGILKDESWKNLLNYIDVHSIEDFTKNIKNDVFIHDIVSNTICADLLDYLQRDNYFCNLNISLEYRFLKYLYLASPSNGEYINKATKGCKRVFIRLIKDGETGPRRDLLTDISRLLEARYMVGERAYFHHTKIIAGSMLGRAISSFSNDLSAHLIEPEAFLENLFCSCSDDVAIDRLLQHEHCSEFVKTLLYRFKNRELYKLAHRFDEACFKEADNKNKKHNGLNHALTQLLNPETRRLYEDELALNLGVNKGSIIIYAPPKKMNAKIAMMNIVHQSQYVKYKDYCDKNDGVAGSRLRNIINSHSKLWAIQVIVDPNEVYGERLTLLKKGFRYKFVTPEQDRNEKRLDYYKDLFDFHFKHEKIQIHGENYVAIRDEFVNSLTADVARDKERFSKPFPKLIKDYSKRCLES